MSQAVDGFSLALDFKVTNKNRERLWKLCHRMNDIVLAGGGKFYFAKDATLRSEDLAYFGTVTLEKLKRLKSALDPDGILETDLSKRLFSKV